MKNLLYIVVIVIAFASCKTEKKTIEAQKLAEKLTYSVNLENPVNNLPVLTNFDNKGFIDNILAKIKDSLVQAYKFNVNVKTEITFADVEKNFGAGAEQRVVEFEDGQMREVLIQMDIRSQEVKDLIFIENWNFDENNLQITKDVKGISVIRPIHDAYDSLLIYMTTPFMVYFNDSAKHVKNIVCQRAEYTVKLSKCDSLFIDYATFDSKKLIDLMLEKVLNKDIPAYDYFSAEKTKLSKDEILDYFDAGEKTVLVENIETGEMEEKTTNEEIHKDQITELVFIEEWSYDKENFNFEKKIIAYGPVREYYKPSRPDKLRTVPFLIYFE